MLRELMPALLKQSTKSACKDLFKKLRPEIAWSILGFSLGFLASRCVMEHQPKRSKESFWPR